jgi:enamine deaminase RidA (YjgF/YER057c/UK114 family)
MPRRRFAALSGGVLLAPVVHAVAKATKRIFTANPNATPKPPYSPAVAYGNLLFVSGKTSHSAPEPTDIRSCVAYALDQVEAELKNAGSSMEKVLKVQIFLRDVNDFAAMNEIFVARFPKEPPARTTIAAVIPGGSMVEIDAVAFV